MEPPLSAQHDAALGVVPLSPRGIQVGNSGASRRLKAVPHKFRAFPLVYQMVRHSLETSLSKDYLMPLTVIPPMM